MEIEVVVANESHVGFAEDICNEIYLSSLERKTGIAKRSPEYIQEKMLAGKAVIAVAENGEFAGFSYIESWGGKSFVANSGLIVAHKFRGLGLAKRIKELCGRNFPVEFRMSGDEFLAFLPGQTQAQAEEFVSNMRAQGESTRIQDISVSVSYGTAEISGPEVNANATVMRADHAMYRDKAQRKMARSD